LQNIFTPLIASTAHSDNHCTVIIDQLFNFVNAVLYSSPFSSYLNDVTHEKLK